ncbi:MAG: hypothetical protein LBP26_01425 [Clostridiales bacterium]|nr:hypothetical protein [Clostridiales bacterium]
MAISNTTIELRERTKNAANITKRPIIKGINNIAATATAIPNAESPADKIELRCTIELGILENISADTARETQKQTISSSVFNFLFLTYIASSLPPQPFYGDKT